ncbi:hypothetical protein SerAS12_1910 [Serratia sp. AS12]|nr:hypothetical protein SerAS9_1910 [Serratia plymuthica AS9]AEF49988.1 hypothetical protein SerAS12_1910 [Serratia sp. AS12]AEG27695.1 hypothetical protein SerAS13_1911 [Serratia sp. AS13]
MDGCLQRFALYPQIGKLRLFRADLLYVPEMLQQPVKPLPIVNGIVFRIRSCVLSVPVDK